MNGNTRLTNFNIFCILLVPFLAMYETSAVAPALGVVAKAFPGASMFELRSVLTMPFIFVFLFSVLSGILAKRFDKKNIMIIGLIMYGICGISPIFASKMTVILVLRLLTGAGVGLAMPIPNTIIAEKFTGETRARLLGLTQVMVNLANVVVTIIVGSLLVIIGWHAAFYAFGFVFVVLLFVIIGVPKSPPQVQVETDVTESTKATGKTLAVIVGLALLMFFNFAVFSFFPTNFAIFVSKGKLVPLWSLGILMALPALASIVSSSTIVQFHKLFGKYLIFCAFAMYTIGFYLLYAATSAGFVIASTILLGLGLGIIPPVILDLTAIKVEPKQKDFAYGVISACMQLGSFLSTFLISAISLAGHNSSLRFLFGTGSVICVIAALVSLVVVIVLKRRASGTTVSV